LKLQRERGGQDCGFIQGNVRLYGGDEICVFGFPFTTPMGRGEGRRKDKELHSISVSVLLHGQHLDFRFIRLVAFVSL